MAKPKRKIEVVDSTGTLHQFEGNENLNFWCSGADCRVYNAKESGTIAQFYNYVSATFTQKEASK